MVSAVKEIAKIKEIGVIDLYTDTAFNDITSDRRTLYMADKIHPTKAGYLDAENGTVHLRLHQGALAIERTQKRFFRIPQNMFNFYFRLCAKCISCTQWEYASSII